MTTTEDPRIEAVARELAGLEEAEPWPTNEELGGSLTGTRDDEYRAGMREQAAELLAAADAAVPILGVIEEPVEIHTNGVIPQEQALAVAHEIADRNKELMDRLMNHERPFPASQRYGKTFAQAVHLMASVTGLNPSKIVDMINVAQTEEALISAGVDVPPTFETPRVTATHAETVPDAASTIAVLAAALDVYPSDAAARDELGIPLGDRIAQRLVTAIRNAQKELAS